MSLSQAFLEVGDQRPAVQQAGEIIVVSQVADSLFGDDVGLQLSK